MNLAALDRLETFALLGPGFGDGRPLLLTDLREDGGAAPRLVFTPFEGDRRTARVLGGRPREVDGSVFAAEPRPLPAHFAEGAYRAHVERIRAAIAAGDVYQVCYTVRAALPAVSGATVLAAMCGRGVPRFAAWVRLPGGPEFVSASPELFFETDGRRVHSEPMKGTARAGAGAVLEASGKDRAELAMITDLVRNDLTPICAPRSVRVPCARRLLELPYAVQTVSDVTGDLLEGLTPLDVLAALHPGGSVTGAPKRAALAMIGALEEGPRGAYCGALGLWEGSRSRFSLLIRTAERREGGWVYGLGSGIVYESSAGQELDELYTKLGALQCASPRSA